MAQVVLEHLTKLYRGADGQSVPALEDASLAVADGELLALVGPSGCGKTTTLRLIAGLEEVTSGTVRMDERIINDVPARDRDIAMVFQHHALYPHLTVEENLAFGLRARALSREEIQRRVRETARLLELEDCLRRRPDELSGGQRQRVAVGRAIAVRPRLFLFDEPLSNLDLPLRSQLRAEIRALHARLGTTMIYVTHDQAEAMTLGQRIAVLRSGRIQQVGEPLRVYRDPANLFVAGFFGTPPMNLFRGILRSEGGALFFQWRAADAASSAMPAGVRLPDRRAASLGAHAGKEVVMGLRPEHIQIASASAGSNLNPLADAVVRFCEPLGSETHVYATCGAQNIIFRAAAAFKPLAGERLQVTIDMREAVFFDAASDMALR
jgi:multiple sugar transport system ATP-binding protein